MSTLAQRLMMATAAAVLAAHPAMAQQPAGAPAPVPVPRPALPPAPKVVTGISARADSGWTMAALRPDNAFFPTEVHYMTDAATKATTADFQAIAATWFNNVGMVNVTLPTRDAQVGKCRADAIRIACPITIDPAPAMIRMEAFRVGAPETRAAIGPVRLQDDVLAVDSLRPGQDYSIVFSDVLYGTTKSKTLLQGRNAKGLNYDQNLARVTTAMPIDAGFIPEVDVRSTNMRIRYDSRAPVLFHVRVSLSDSRTNTKRVVAEGGTLKFDKWGFPDTLAMRVKDSLVLRNLGPDTSYTYSIIYVSKDGRELTSVSEFPMRTAKEPQPIGIDGAVNVTLTIGGGLDIDFKVRGNVQSADLVLDYGKNDRGELVRLTNSQAAASHYKFTVKPDDLRRGLAAVAKDTTRGSGPMIRVVLDGKNPDTDKVETTSFAFTFGATVSMAATNDKALKTIQKAATEGKGDIPWKDLLGLGLQFVLKGATP